MGWRRVSDVQGGPGWWLASDGKWYPPQTATPTPGNEPKGSRNAVLILIGAIVLMLVAGTVAVLMSRQSKGSTGTAAVLKQLPAQTTAPTNPVTAANQVTSCMHAHSMTFASEVSLNPVGTASPFLQSNGNDFTNTGITEYQVHMPVVTLFQSCVWPPPSWADQTGYSQIVMTSAPGDSTWPGNISPYALADVVDSSCQNISAEYSGEQTGSSFSLMASVGPGALAVAGGDGSGFGDPPGTVNGADTISTWGQALGSAIQPGESVILHPGNATVKSAECVG
jgi:hypothetical protein